jgi:hypothetical protein
MSEQEIPPVDSHLFERNTRYPSSQLVCMSHAFPPGLSEHRVVSLTELPPPGLHKDDNVPFTDTCVMIVSILASLLPQF